MMIHRNRNLLLLQASTLVFVWLHQLFRGMEKVDVFLFRDKLNWPSWIVYIAGWHFTNISLSFIIAALFHQHHPNTVFSYITKGYFIFAVIRMVEYHTFRGSDGFIGVTIILTLAVFIMLFVGGKKST